MISTLPKKGHLLIAEPSILGDVSFNRWIYALTKEFYLSAIVFYTIHYATYRRRLASTIVAEKPDDLAMSDLE